MFGTGGCFSNAGVGISSIGRLSYRLSGAGGKTIFGYIPSCADAVYPLSAGGIFSCLYADRRGAFAVAQPDIRPVSFLFRQLLCGVFRRGWNLSGSDSFGLAGMHHHAMLLLFGAAVLGSGLREPLGREKQTTHRQEIPVDAFGVGAWNLADRCVYGSDDFALSAGAGLAALFLKEQEREGLFVTTGDVTRFSAYLTEEKHSSQNTISSYLRDVTQFAEYLHSS